MTGEAEWREEFGNKWAGDAKGLDHKRRARGSALPACRHRKNSGAGCAWSIPGTPSRRFEGEAATPTEKTLPHSHSPSPAPLENPRRRHLRARALEQSTPVESIAGFSERSDGGIAWQLRQSVCTAVPAVKEGSPSPDSDQPEAPAFVRALFRENKPSDLRRTLEPAPRQLRHLPPPRCGPPPRPRSLRPGRPGLPTRRTSSSSTDNPGSGAR